MIKILRLIKLSFRSLSDNIGSCIVLILLMIFSVIAFNKIIGYIRYQNQISSTFLKSDLKNAIAFCNFDNDRFVNDDVIKQLNAINDIEGVKGVGDRLLLFYQTPLDESLWSEYRMEDGSTHIQKDLRGPFEIYNDIYAKSCYIPLKKGRQLTEADNLPDDVTPILISEDLLVHFPFDKVREITISGLGNNDEKWDIIIKVQTVGIINPGSAIIAMEGSASGLNHYTVSRITRFVSDTKGTIISAMPKIYEDDIMKYGIFLNYTSIVQVEDGYVPSEVAKELMLLDGKIGATPLNTLIDKMRDNYRKDIASYLVDLIITFGISLVSICGFNILSQRRQREQLSIYYMCGFSWSGCIAFDVLKTIFVVGIPGAVALLVEKIRLLIGLGTSSSDQIINFLVNTLKFDEIKVSNFMFNYGINTKGGFALHDVGYFVDKYTFIYSFLLIVGMYILSSVWFHISMLKTRPADEIRKWQ